MHQHTAAFQEQDRVIGAGPALANEEHTEAICAANELAIERDNREAWVADNWGRLRENGDLLAVLALGPKALAALVSRMMVEIGCEPEDAMDVREIVECSERKDAVLDCVKRRAATAYSRGDLQAQLESIRSLMSVIATDVRVLQVTMKHHAQQTGE